MRVLHIVPALFGADGGVFGGAERYALELARHMADEVPTSLVAFGNAERRETLGRLSVRIIGNPWHVRGQHDNPLSLSLLSDLRRADVVHCHQAHVVTSSLTALACRLSGRRVFATDHGGGAWDISAYLSTERWYNGHLHVSEYSRRISRRAPHSRSHVIHGGVDTRKFSPDPSVGRDGSVLFVGRLLPHKGVSDLIKAVDLDQRLELIGQPYDAGYFQHLREIAASKQVVFRHDCDDGALAEAYRKALCLVLPSVHKSDFGGRTAVPELLGQTLLEAMACATPVICTNVASLPEIVADGVAGFIVPPNDPAALRHRIRWLGDHPAQARAMGLAARSRVLERFTWPAVVRRCLEIYGAPNAQRSVQPSRIGGRDARRAAPRATPGNSG